MGIEHRGVVTGTGRFTLDAPPAAARRGSPGPKSSRSRGGWADAAGALAAKPVLRSVWKRNLRRLQHIIELGVMIMRLELRHDRERRSTVRARLRWPNLPPVRTQ